MNQKAVALRIASMGINVQRVGATVLPSIKTVWIIASQSIICRTDHVHGFWFTSASQLCLLGIPETEWDCTWSRKEDVLYRSINWGNNPWQWRRGRWRQFVAACRDHLPLFLTFVHLRLYFTCLQSLPWESQNGPAFDFALLGVVREFGCDENTLESIAEQIGTRTNTVKQRLEVLSASHPDDEDRKGQE